MIVSGFMSKQNKKPIQIFYCTYDIMLKRLTSWRAYLRVIAPPNTAPFEEMLQRWQAHVNTANLTANVSNLTGLRFEPQISRSTDERATA